MNGSIGGPGWGHPRSRQIAIAHRESRFCQDALGASLPVPGETVEPPSKPHVRELITTARVAAPRLAVAVVALVLAVVAIVVALFSHPLVLLGSLAGLVVAIPLAIAAALGGGLVRRIALPTAILAAAVPASLLLLREKPLALVVMVLLLVVSALAARGAVRSAVGRRPTSVVSPGARVGPAARAVLLANPKSGGGKVGRLSLAEEARRRGIEIVFLDPGDDLRLLAVEAAERGADVIGMAGGDGSQAVVAQVAMERDLALVCVPVGTRNHFAKDLGLDPADPVGVLDAFAEAEERRIDLATVGDRVFVNNVSLGVYADLVGAEGYRENKPLTAWRILPNVLGPGARPVDLRFTGPDAQEYAGFQLVMVSNGRYNLTADRRFGSRERMDLGVLGIIAVRAGEGDEFPRFAEAWWEGKGDPSRGWLQWATPDFEVRSNGPIPTAVDGEAMTFSAPLRFRSLTGALRVRMPRRNRGSTQDPGTTAGRPEPPPARGT
jgi:diacylglycerol kinase family enzyme